MYRSDISLKTKREKKRLRLAQLVSRCREAVTFGQWECGANVDLVIMCRTAFCSAGEILS